MLFTHSPTGLISSSSSSRPIDPPPHEKKNEHPFRKPIDFRQLRLTCTTLRGDKYNFNFGRRTSRVSSVRSGLIRCANVFQMSPCAAAAGYDNDSHVLLADQTYEDRPKSSAAGSKPPGNSATGKVRTRSERKEEDTAADVSALYRHFLATYNIRPDFFCKFQARATGSPSSRCRTSAGMSL